MVTVIVTVIVTLTVIIAIIVIIVLVLLIVMSNSHINSRSIGVPSIPSGNPLFGVFSCRKPQKTIPAPS